LSLIYGLMRILNLAHGSYYILGAYVGLSVLHATASFALATVAAVALVVALGVVMERFVLRRLPQHEELPQALMTFGILLIVGDVSLWIWGGTPTQLPKPEGLSSSVRFAGMIFPSYRLFVIAVGIVVGLALWIFQERTRLGAMIRAAIDDAEIARATGINVSLLSTGVFALGAALAALGGIIGGPLVGVYPGADFEILFLAYAGLPSLGHAAYFGVAAYTTALLSLRLTPNFWLDFAAGLIAAAITAALFGLLALRAQGSYLLMITLALAQVLWGIAFGW